MRLKCEATGKSIFPTHAEAKNSILRFRNPWKAFFDNRRRKHRQGKAAQKRIYYCTHCKGYHLTKWTYFYEPKEKSPVAHQLIISKNKKTDASNKKSYLPWPLGKVKMSK